ncbi:hypothetical protein BJP34_19035 [Moorena producens PAL-8-15-08-1]|uniref:Uncharacterized protein n=1 Tax=Moorena producens PAL-8-15-08-1 TaxID=1458985 RepID=A0A1D8TUC2_9CYAN|nr:hypothetical protein [Moorena producens]AOX01252.1 hypothetical protein BJP34_19035 [Moorena producens PAL-8-15-08-1]
MVKFGSVSPLFPLLPCSPALIYNLQPATSNLKPATLNLQPRTFNLGLWPRYANNLQPATLAFGH